MMNAHLSKTLWKNRVFTFLAGLTFVVTPSLFFSPLVRADLEFPVEEMTEQFKPQVAVPILLPSSMPSRRGSMYFEGQVHPTGYFISFSANENCRATACIHGGMSAESSGFFTPRPPESDSRNKYQTVSLANGIEGFYYKSCKTYCSGIVEWKYEGVLYRIVLTNSSLEELKAIVNSAIEAGPR